MIDSLIQRQFKYTFALMLVCLLLACVSASAQTDSAPLPTPTGNAVNDFAGIIDSGTRQQLETILINLKRQQKIEFAVVTVKTTGGQDIVDYSMALAKQWGVGPAEGTKDGLLLVIAVDDHRYQTLVSRYLQGELPDGLAGSIQRQYLVPAFSAGDYGKGVMDTIRAYIDTIAEKRGFSTAEIYGQTETSQPRGRQPVRSNQPNSISTCCAIIFILIFIILLFSGRGGGSGCLNMLLLGSLFSGGRGGGWSSGGWSSGGWSGGGGGGGGFGGFGGGGDFDGGGAGGSW